MFRSLCKVLVCFGTRQHEFLGTAFLFLFLNAGWWTFVSLRYIRCLTVGYSGICLDLICWRYPVCTIAFFRLLSYGYTVSKFPPKPRIRPMFFQTSEEGQVSIVGEVRMGSDGRPSFFILHSLIMTMKRRRRPKRGGGPIIPRRQPVSQHFPTH